MVSIPRKTMSFMRQVLNPDNGKFHVLHENISNESSYVILTEIQTIDRSSNESLLTIESWVHRYFRASLSRAILAHEMNFFVLLM